MGDGFDEFAQVSDALFTVVRATRGRIADEGGLSLSQARLLDPLAVEPTLPVGRLAARADIAVPTATRMLQGLERDGVVTRRRARHSERVVEIALTTEGVRKLKQQTDRLRARQRQTYDALPPSQRAQAVDLLRRITELARDL